MGGVTKGLLLACLVGLANVAGGLLVTTRVRRNEKALNFLVAFGAGFMLAVAILEMMPHALDVAHGLTAVLVGYLAVHLTQHVLTPHFHFGEETHGDAMVNRGIGVWALVGLIPHSFFDGVAIMGGYLVGPDVGMLVFLAVLLHKVPTGVSLASVMLASGNSVRTSIIAVSVVALATVVGAILTPALDVLALYGFSLAAGVTVYVAASNLIPESQRQHGWFVPSGVFFGALAFVIIRLMMPGSLA